MAWRFPNLILKLIANNHWISNTIDYDYDPMSFLVSLIDCDHSKKHNRSWLTIMVTPCLLPSRVGFSKNLPTCCASISVQGFWLHVSTIKCQSTAKAKQLNLLTKGFARKSILCQLRIFNQKNTNNETDKPSWIQLYFHCKFEWFCSVWLTFNMFFLHIKSNVVYIFFQCMK